MQTTSPRFTALASLASSLAASLALVGCADDPRGPAGQRVQLPGDTFYPEGIAFDRGGRMFVASIPTGQIVRVDDGASAPVELVAAGALGQSAVGMKMSREDDLLWICDGTYGTDFPPSVIGIDPDTGAERVRHHFPAQRDGRTGGLCNEIAEDGAGNVYASDSFGARVLRVAAADRLTPDRAVAWAEGAELGAPMFGVNGIAFDGALLAVNTSAGTLHRIALADAKISPVALERPLAGPDGLRIERTGRAIVVEQSAGAVSRIDLTTGAVDILKDGLRDPTSLDLIDGTAWVSEGQLSHLFDMTAPGLPFEVVRVQL
jgi:sugar lactone lactonase YvrE